MAATNSTPKHKALALLNEALACGIRGANKRAVEQAIAVLNSDGKDGISDLACKNLKYGDKPLRDTLQKGLRLDPKKSGNIWIFRYTWKENDKITQPEIQFGQYPQIRVAEAREKAAQARSDIRQGRHPSGASSASDMTVRVLCDKYMELAEDVKRSWREDLRQINSDIIPAWGDRKAADITREDANKLLQAIWTGEGRAWMNDGKNKPAPRSAEKLLALGRFMFNLASGEIRKKDRKKWFINGENTSIKPWITIDKNPFADVELTERDTSSCTLKGKTLKSYLRSFDTATFSPDVANVLKLQLWCNTRISEPAHMDWKEVDLEDGIWTIPAERTKTNAEIDVMLPRQAVDLLKSLDVKDSGYVFAFKGMRRDNVSTHIAEQIRINRKHLDVPDNFTTHSLRHTGQTLLARMKCPVEVRDRVSNHKTSGMAALYNSHEYDDDAREWLQKMADQLDELAQPNVIQIGERNAD